jgi:deoxyribodipyrimidine photo-lyase
LEPERIGVLAERPAAEGGRYVLYWMQQAQRAEHNPALEHAIALANARGQGVVVGFGLTNGYPDANARHYAFMLEGLKETAATLARRGIRLVLRRGDPAEVALGLAREASLVVCDKGYLRHQRAWRERVAQHAGRLVLEIEGEVVVPVRLASQKAEIGARTLRPRLLALRERLLNPLPEEPVRVPTLALDLKGDLDPADPEGNLRVLNVDRSVPPSSRFRGGTAAARARLRMFLAEKLSGYAAGRNEPAAGQISGMSPYLHFGQISPVELALAVASARPPAIPTVPRTLRS